MIRHNLYHSIYSLLLVFFFNSGNAQSQKQHQQIVNEPKAIINRHPKLIKSQGSNEYQTVCCGLQDKAGNLWFGTSGEGVYRYDGKLFTQFTIADGLSCNSVRSILEDKSGNIWFGTRDGLCRYDGKTITHFKLSKISRLVVPSVLLCLRTKTKVFGLAPGARAYTGTMGKLLPTLQNITGNESATSAMQDDAGFTLKNFTGK